MTRKKLLIWGKMLESLGYTVDIRSDGLSALKELQEDPQKYDLACINYRR